MCWSCRTVPSTMEAMTRAKILSSCAALLLGVTGLAGCSADTDDDAPPQATSPREPAASESGDAGDDSDVPVVRPGLPGEPAKSGGAVTTEEPAPWNHSDIAFVQMMIPHHAQALEMSRLAPERAENRQVRGLAERIEAAQAPEILLMASWLEEQNIDVPSAAEDPLDYDHGAHGHDGMEGMLTPRELKELAAARGRAFDRLYLSSMIRHHEGALMMADRVAVDGSALLVRELAADVASGQSAEIGRMQELLKGL